MYQKEQILFTIMLTMLKYHVIKYHKKTSQTPCLGTPSTMNDRPPRLHQALWSPHNSPHYEWLMRRSLILLGYDPSSKMSPKSHTTITVSTKGSENLLTYLAASHP
ncbi:hypothetical protein AVEN_229646-1 [Araneus ventricosus]|uniref:Uncharacterized protein n=1 Tax=Araneus ventricosus TaxID=182803 RepID=A0A4Y2X5J2_ARAVE|nr:hypothetical protein AVEN_229646-1 [Araneus ventricosus]